MAIAGLREPVECFIATPGLMSTAGEATAGDEVCKGSWGEACKGDCDCCEGDRDGNGVCEGTWGEARNDCGNNGGVELRGDCRAGAALAFKGTCCVAWRRSCCIEPSALELTDPSGGLFKLALRDMEGAQGCTPTVDSSAGEQAADCNGSCCSGGIA